MCPALSPGLLGHVEHVVEMEAPFLQLAEDNLGGKDLGG